VGSGIYLLPASLASLGAVSLLGWIFTTTGALLLALVLAKLSFTFPAAGGPYAFTRDAFGDFAGFLVTWGYWISICVGNAAIAVALVGYLASFWPAIVQHPAVAAGTALGNIWFLTLVNCLGVRKAGRLQLATTVLKLVPLLVIGTIGFAAFDRSNLTPFNPSGTPLLHSVNSAATLTLWAFLGLESATIPLRHISNPKRTIPLATVLGTIITAAIYISSSTAVLGIIPREELQQATAPYAVAAAIALGPWAAYLVAFGAVVACFGALNGWILLQGQFPMAAADDRLFPRLFARRNNEGTPVAGLVVSSLLVSGIVLTNYTRALVEQFTLIILLATLTTLFPYIFSSMAALLLRTKYPDKFSTEVHPGVSVAVALLAFLYSAWAVAGSGESTVYWGFLLLICGIPVYVWLKREPGGEEG